MDNLRALKRRRAATSGCITKLANRVEKQADINPAILDKEQLLQYQANLQKHDNTFNDLHQDIIDSHLDLIDEMEEDRTLENHCDAVEELSAAIRRLLSLHDAASRIQSLEDISLELLKEVDEDPTKPYEATIKSCRQKLNTLEDIIAKSTIPLEHPLRHMFKQLNKRLTKITHSVRDPPTDSVASTTSSSGPRVQKYNLPKLQLPEFDGNPLNWPAFWQRFSSAIHTNEALEDVDKLTYLRQAIKDKAAHDLVMTPSTSPDQYQQLIATLKDRFDQRRLIHETHLMAIINHDRFKTGSHEEVCSLHDSLCKHIAGLKNTSQFTLETALTSITASKLNNRYREAWLNYSKDRHDVPDIDLMMSFLKEKTKITQTHGHVSPSTKPPAAKQQQHSQYSERKPKATVYTVQPTATCKHCNGPKHPLYLCSVFKGLHIDGKLQLVQAEQLCYNCLAPGHKLNECRSSNRCRKCGKAHHTVIHKDAPPASVNTVSNGAPAEVPLSSAVVNCTSVRPTEDAFSLVQGAPQFTLQMTSQVIVHSPSGRQLKARALLDSGASISLVTQRLAQQLKLDKQKHSISISGVQGSTTGSSSHSASLQLSSRLDNTVNLYLTAAIVPKVATDLPLRRATGIRTLPFLQNLELADPMFDTPSRIDIILGTNVLQDILLPDIEKGTADQPIAMKTIFGWALSGRYILNTSILPPVSETCNLTTDLSGDELLLKFWNLEEVSTHQSCGALTPEETTALTHFEQNHSYTAQGLYQVALPRKPDCQPLGDSRSQAVRRFLSNESNLKRKDKWQSFQDVVQEYLDLGHAEPVPASDLSKPSSETYYMPMHAVIKASSTTTQLRVVFDASAKTSSGISLNDTLMVGPTIYPPLVDILLRFRCNLVAISADVSKMYRAVKLVDEDKDFHRFVWRPTDAQLLTDFRMTRITFGVSASPFVATRTLQQVATDFGKDLPLAAKEVTSSFYVDDCLSGADTPQAAMELQSQLQELLQKGGFTLRKWRSNDSRVMDAIPAHLHERNPKQELLGTADYLKTLGVHWDTTTDNFYVSTSKFKMPSSAPTKRHLISDIARTFDVLGWFSPATVLMKILLQVLWKRKVEWDEEVPPDICQIWQEWRSQLPLLNTFPIRRHYFSSTSITSRQLHGFSDASESAYAAVVYIRAIYTNKPPTLTLVAAKTKVAPVKKETVPRLELCGALLLAKLTSTVSKALNIPISDITAWTDSTIVLSWLDGTPRRYKTYVGNRIASVLELLPASAWHHVPTMDNPADCGSRGLLPQDLLEHRLWWDGPTWLWVDPPQFPPQPRPPKDTPPEVKEDKASCNIAIAEEPWIVCRFSSFIRLRRVPAWICRFLSNCRPQEGKQPLKALTLTCAELQMVDTILIQQAQQRCFSQELSLLAKKQALPRRSILQPLNPVIDNGTLRVGGRLGKSPFPYHQKHPIILHAKDVLTQLIVRQQHWDSFHSGPTLLMATVNLQYHIIGAKRLCKAIYRKCIVCLKFTARTSQQQMGQLPTQRVTPGTVFDKVGLDFAGPIYTKQGYTRKPTILKTYVCVFVSFTTKAVHLEPVSDLTSNAFLAAFRRFTARRGRPSEVFSDNGTNFVGAANELVAISAFLKSSSNQATILDHASNQSIIWHFSPERAPHFGGLWEAAVKSFKRHLKKVMGEQRFTFEELSTTLCQVEACLNSRPLVPLETPDSDGMECLTPAHFLVGKSLLSLPEQDSSHLKLSLLKRWNLCQRMIQDFWTRWSTEYICTLQRLAKWRTPTRSLQVGDIVLVKDTSLSSPTHWPLAKVTATHPSQDGQVRVVTLTTAQGVYKRPITKLAVIIPTTSELQDDTSSGPGMLEFPNSKRRTTIAREGQAHLPST